MLVLIVLIVFAAVIAGIVLDGVRRHAAMTRAAGRGKARPG